MATSAVPAGRDRMKLVGPAKPYRKSGKKSYEKTMMGRTSTQP
jgi:hypothetical protein